MAALQHNGAATCLIDFTTNFHVALWFACATTKTAKTAETNGRVFIVNRGDIENIQGGYA